MKKIYSYLIAAVVIVAAVACKKVDNKEPQLGETVTFYATIENDSDSKAILDGLTPKWSGTEYIQILGNNNNYHFTANVGATPTTQTTFTYSGTPAYNETQGVLAIYPDNPYGHNVSEGPYNGRTYGKSLTTKTVHGVIIPTKVEYTEHPIANCHAPMIAYTTGNELAFKNVAAILKFQTGNKTARGLTFAGNNAEIISGVFDVRIDGSTVTTTPFGTYDGPKTYKEIYAPGTSKLVQNQTYYMAIAPKNFLNGFKVELQFAEGAQKIEIKNLSAEKELKRNVIYDLGTITYTPPARTVFLQPNSTWTAENGRYAIYAFKGGASMDEQWVSMFRNGDGIYQAAVPADMNNLIFVCLKNGTTGNSWANKKYQTADLTYPTSNTYLFTIPGTTGDGAGNTNWSFFEL